MGFTIRQNAASVARRIGGIGPSIRRRLSTRVLVKAADSILEDSRSRTPIRYRELIASHRRSKPYGRLNWVAISVHVGNTDAWYAHIVHEDTTLAHDDGEAKFLENAVMAHVKVIRRHMQAEVTHIWKTLPSRSL